MGASLKTHSQGQTLVLTISNPEHRNALGPDIYAAGVEALSVAESNSDIRTVVITGEGAHFCAGGNLQRLLGNRQQAPQVQAESIEGLHNWIETIRAFPKPVIAAVEGACAGAGFSLALACDLIVAARDAVFVMAYSNVGLSPDGGATWSLMRALPRATALQLLLAGERTDASRLHQLGVVTQVSDPSCAMADALSLADRLNARAPNALASIKELANDAITSALHTQLAAERDHFVRNLHHANGGEGIQAFLERRPPSYR
ncbi:MAG: oxepin-CoA hydrolase, alternative type [Gammaproteobacteria bacterium]